MRRKRPSLALHGLCRRLLSRRMRREYLECALYWERNVLLTSSRDPTDATQKPKRPGGAAKIVPLIDPEKVTSLTLLGEEPAWIDCQFCRRRTKTRVQKEDSTATT